MPKPNRTVAEWRRKNPFPPREPRPLNPEFVKIVDDCQAGRITVAEGARLMAELMNSKPRSE